jgi:hypothetical protein
MIRQDRASQQLLQRRLQLRVGTCAELRCTSIEAGYSDLASNQMPRMMSPPIPLAIFADHCSTWVVSGRFWVFVLEYNY